MTQISILMVSAFDPLPGEGRELIRYPILAEALVKKGVKLTYLTSSFEHFSKKPRIQSQGKNPFSVHYISAPAYHKNVSLKRLWSHGIFARNLMRFLKKEDAKYDAIISAFPPIEANVRLSIWARQKGIPFFVDVQDLWPEAFEAKVPAFLSGWLLRAWKARRGGVLERAKRVFAVSEDYLKSLNAEEKGKCFPLGAHFPEKIPPAFQADSEKIRLIFLAGSDQLPFLPALLQAFEKLPSHYVLMLVGRSRHFCGKKDTDRISYHHDVSEEEKQLLLLKANIGLVINELSLFSRLPNKLFSYLNYGLPIISNLRGGELEKLLEKESWGKCCAGDLSDFTEKVLGVVGEKRHEEKTQIFDRAKALFDKKNLYNSYANEILDDIS